MSRRFRLGLLAIAAAAVLWMTAEAQEGAEPRERPLVAGWNLVAYEGPPAPVATAMASVYGEVLSVWAWVASDQRWLSWGRLTPAFLDTLPQMEPRGLYWILMDRDALWRPPDPPTQISVAELLTTCPTPEEMAQIEQDFVLDFSETDVPPFACEDGIDPAGGNPRLATFQIFRVLRTLTFDEPLPWTPLPLYHWMREAVTGIRFFEGDGFSRCCDAQGRMYIKVGGTQIISSTAARHFVQPGARVGLKDTLSLFVHEARHGDGLPHTCPGQNDQTLEEMGAWGVVHTLFRLLADGTDDALTEEERAAAGAVAGNALTRICDLNPA